MDRGDGQDCPSYIFVSDEEQAVGFGPEGLVEVAVERWGLVGGAAGG